MSTLSLLLCAALPLQAFILRLTQRRIFWDIDRVGRSRMLAYLLVMPSTVAHELAHASAAALLRVPFGRAVGGKVELFRPRAHPDGSMTLGQVSVGATDPLRGGLISIAPFLLVPLMLVGINWALLDVFAPTDAIGAFSGAEPWRIVLWCVLSLTLPLAAFPSPGDHIGIVGAICLVAFTALAGFVVVDQGGVEALIDIGALWSSVLILPAVVCLVLLVLLRVRIPRRR